VWRLVSNQYDLTLPPKRVILLCEIKDEREPFWEALVRNLAAVETQIIGNEARPQRNLNMHLRANESHRGSTKNIHTNLKSSWLKSSSWNSSTEVLTLETKQGRKIRIPGVEERDHWLFTHSPPGKFYHHHLKSKVDDGSRVITVDGRSIRVDAMTYQQLSSQIAESVGF